LPDVVHGAVPEPVQRIAAGVAEWLDQPRPARTGTLPGSPAPTPTSRGSMGAAGVAHREERFDALPDRFRASQR
jgi:hypothetical protein